jgi:glycosyltransferase involved in cell wall biosynthesis
MIFPMQEWRRRQPRFFRRGRSSPVRVLFFSHETTWSGAPIQLLHLTTWLHRSGWKVAVVVPTADTPQAGPITSELSALGVEIFPLLDLSVAPDLANLRSLCARFDFVVANTLVMWAAVRAAHDAGVPVIWYIHETRLVWRLIELSPDIQPTLELPDLIVLPTRQTARLHAQLTHRTIEVVPYGIPPAKVCSETNRDSNRTRFLLLGSYEPRKGQDLLLEAIAQLPAAVQEATFFEMVGRKLDEPFYETLAKVAADLPHVRLRDALEHDEALAANAAADVLVCASRDETMPIAILEAMSLGKAIITTNVGGITEWLRDGVNALIVPADESEAMARAITRCVEEPRLIKSLGKRARRTFSAEFSLDRLGRRFSKLIQRTLREKKK